MAHRTYAVTVNGQLRGTFNGDVERGRISIAGAVTRDGSPVNRATAQLHTDPVMIEKAEELKLPVFELKEHSGIEFITDWYDPEYGGYHN